MKKLLIVLFVVIPELCIAQSLANSSFNCICCSAHKTAPCEWLGVGTPNPITMYIVAEMGNEEPRGNFYPK